MRKVGLVAAVALAALGACKGTNEWRHCTAFYLVDEETGTNVQSMSGRPIDEVVLRYRVVGENPPAVEVYRRTKTDSGMTEEESRVIVLKPGQNTQCISIK